MNNKVTTLQLHEQYIEAGVAPEDNNIEFIGNRFNKTVIWLQNGKSYRFNELPGSVFKDLRSLYLSDINAQTLIKTNYPQAKAISKQVHLYTYYMFGGFDKFPDVFNGLLQPSENFRDTDNCISLQFDHKVVSVNKTSLKRRYIKMLDLFAEGELDTNIALSLNIAMPTYDFHKRKLFQILNVNSKPEAVSVAYKNHVLCAR